MGVVANENARTRATCERCGETCKVAEHRDENAKMLRHADKPKGLCANCAVTQWFIVMGLAEMHPSLPKALELPHVQKQFAAVMASGGADMKPEEINWTKVVEHWTLPFPGVTARARRKSGARRG